MSDSADKPNSFTLPGMASLNDFKASTEKKWSDAVKGATETVTAGIDSGIDVVAGVVRSTAATVQTGAGKAKSEAEDIYGVGKAHWEQAEERVLSKLREGVALVTEHQNESIAAVVVLAAVLLPGPRRFLYRNTLGRLRSEEALFRSAEYRASALAERLEGQTEELGKLQERVAAAQVEYQRGLANLKSAASQLHSLSSRVAGTEKNARALVSDLRQLPSKAALQLRADTAQAAALAASQRSAIEKMVVRLAKQGV